jgi:hypothetical protein
MKRGSLLEKIVNGVVAVTNAVVPATTAQTMWVTAGQATTTAASSPTVWLAGTAAALTGCADHNFDEPPETRRAYQYANMDIFFDDKIFYDPQKSQDAFISVLQHYNAYASNPFLTYTLPNGTVGMCPPSPPNGRVEVHIYDEKSLIWPGISSYVFSYNGSHQSGNSTVYEIHCILNADRGNGANAVDYLFDELWNVQFHSNGTINPPIQLLDRIRAEGQRTVDGIKFMRGIP